MLRPLKRVVLSTPGYSSLTVRLGTLIENQANVHLLGNRRPARMANLGSAAISQMTSTGTKPVDTFIKLRDTEGFTLDNKKLRRNAYEQIDKVVAALISKPVVVRDYGKCLLDEIADEADWDIEYYVSPGMGYPRPGVRVTFDPYSRYEGDTDPTLLAIDPGGQPSKSYAEFLIRMDRVRMGPETIPVQSPSIGGHDKKEQPFGVLLSETEQGLDVLALGALYIMQLAMLGLGVNKAWKDACYDLASSIGIQYSKEIDRFNADYEFILSLPRHPFSSMIINRSAAGVAQTSKGDRPCYLRTAEARGVKLGMVRSVGIDCQVDEGMMINNIVEAALRPFKNPRGKRPGSKDAENDGGVDCEYPYQWDFTRASESGFLTITELAERLRGTPELLVRMNKMADKLGWGTAGSTGSMGVVDTYSGEFMMTDGRGYTDEPAKAVMGVTPVLPIANVKATGITTQYWRNWNMEGVKRIKFSTIVVKGHQGSGSGPYEYERSFLPSGMFMGEANVMVTRSILIMNEEPGITIMDHFRRQQSQGYMEDGYLDVDPESATGNDTVVQTDWDPMGSGNEAKVQADWVGVVSASGQLVAIDDLEILRPSDNEVFYHRVPVRISHNYQVQLYDEMGTLTSTEDWRGSVITDDGELSLSKTTAELEAIVALLPQPKSTGSAALDANLTEEVKVERPE